MKVQGMGVGAAVVDVSQDGSFDPMAMMFCVSVLAARCQSRWESDSTRRSCDQ